DPAVYVLTDRSGTSYRIDRRGGLLGVEDSNGNELVFGDDGIQSSSGAGVGGLAALAATPSGLGVTFIRDAQHRITEIETPAGTIEYSYSPAGDLTGVQYPNGTTQSFTYDAQHSLLTTSGGGQVVRTLHYDAAGRITAVTDGNGNTSTIAIDVSG